MKEYPCYTPAVPTEASTSATMERRTEGRGCLHGGVQSVMRDEGLRKGGPEGGRSGSSGS
jgi:hypothetical protein